MADNQKLFEVIGNHVITGGNYYSRGLETGPILSMHGATVDVKVSPGELISSIFQISTTLLFPILIEGITYGGANVIIPDLTNVQGVIHIIDAVILTDSQLPSINKKY